MTPGLLVAFEGLDQSGKQTQAEALMRHFREAGQPCRLLSFPDYATPIGAEIGRGLHGEREYGADVMQLLYVANRHEKRPEIVSALNDGVAIVCDRYIASSIAYGEAHGLDAAWLRRDPALPAAAGSVHPARYRARNGGRPEDDRTRSLRARSGAAVAGATELPPAGGGIRPLASPRCRSSARGRCRPTSSQHSASRLARR